MAARFLPATDSMAGMQHGESSAGQDPTVKSLQAIFERMMADPVIRERVATDPALQRMLGALRTNNGASIGGTAGMNTMPGMGTTPEAENTSDMENMPGMGNSSVSSTSPAGTREERQRTMEFVVRLLSDPAIEGKIHSDPALHALWSDPAVQKRLQELKSKTPPKLPGKQ